MKNGVFENETLLITGGAGFVGSNLTRLALNEGVERIVIIDNFLSSEREAAPRDPRIEVIEGSMSDEEIVTGLRDEFDYVFHLATFHGNQNSIARPLEDHENNAFPTLRLYEQIKEYRRLKKVIYAASGCVLAPHTDSSPTPVTEEGGAPFDLDSPYQISKILGEFYSVYYFRSARLPTVRARFQNVYGPGEILGAGKWRGTDATVWRNVVPTFIYRALKGESIVIEGDGSSSRDFIFIKDIAEGLVRCAKEGTPGDVYNLASGVETSILELAQHVNELTNNPKPILYKPARKWDQARRRVGSTEKARNALDFCASTLLQKGLEETVLWARAQLPTIEKCIKRHQIELNVE